MAVDASNHNATTLPTVTSKHQTCVLPVGGSFLMIIQQPAAGVAFSLIIGTKLIILKMVTV